MSVTCAGRMAEMNENMTIKGIEISKLMERKHL